MEAGGRYEAGLFKILAFGLLALLLVLSVSASANPNIPPGDFPSYPRGGASDTTFRLSEPLSGILWLFFLNVLLDLLVLSASILFLTRTRPLRSGLRQTSGLGFLAALIGSGALIASIGAIVDFYLITQPRFLQAQGGMFRVISLDIGAWVVALALIALSILIAVRLIMGMRLNVGARIAVVFMCANVSSWILIGQYGELVSFLALVLSVLATPVAVRGLYLWYLAGPSEPDHIAGHVSARKEDVRR